MILLSVTLPNEKVPTWQDAMVLNVGIGVLPELKVTATDHEWLVPNDQEYAPIIHMTLFYNFSKGRYTPSFVGLQARHEITGTDLREIRVAELVRLASSAGIYVKRDRDDPPASVRDWYGDDGMSFVGNDLELLIKSKGPNGWVLDEVAFVYNVAQISSQPPAKAVEKAFGLSARTAARWIAKAREQGNLKRPAYPGWEDTVADADEERRMLASGEPWVREVTADDMRAWGIPVKGDDNGER